jgi:pyrroline-5-carboxylate reductase
MATGDFRVNKVVFIGAGNMTEALVKGMIAGDLCKAERIFVTDVRPERLAFFEKEFQIEGSEDNSSAIKNADVAVLAVKPQMMGEILEGLKESLDPRSLVVSIAAGLSTAWIETRLGDGIRVVRVMPNTPALVRAGAAALCGGRWAKEEDLCTVETMMCAVGIAVRVQEKDMDAVTALSGSGPAYVFHLMEAMQEAAHHAGLEDAVAQKLIYATVEGSAKLAEATGVDPAELRRRVTSKDGTTAAAFEVLEKKIVYHAYLEAIAAAHRRARDLSGG